MKTILTTLNAKYIHTSLALRWLYVANKDKFDISFSEFTIKENIENIANDILSQKPDIVGISVSIWNVEQSKRLASKLKQKNKNIIIILGGPEVSYEPEFFINNWDIDFTISGEGEFVLGELLNALHNSSEVNIEAVSYKNNISEITAQADIEKLVKLESPYKLKSDVNDLGNRMVYFETSRGCPYQCQYCLSSLEKGVRYFPQDYIFDNLKYLINENTKNIKFLDRTFNLNKVHTEAIWGFLIKNYRQSLSCQFEVYADLLDSESIEFLNKNLPENFFRFEIGIQSTYEPTNIAVKRNQNFDILKRNIEHIMQGNKIDLHLDLIAGLPFETYELFVNSFNEVFALKAKELQLGFLKMLRGTAIRNNANDHEYIFEETAPYEIISNTYISAQELKRIHNAEYTLNRFWNSGRFPLTMNKVFEEIYKNRYFNFFDDLAKYYEENKLPKRAYQLTDLFQNLHNFLLSKNIDATSCLRDDYYSNFNSRPRTYWLKSFSKEKRKKLLRKIGQDNEFLQKHRINRRLIEKQTAIDKLENNKFLLTVFLDDGIKMQIEYDNSKEY
ncbi:MAG: DUF4080 domain-containing protein [Bacteroidales bacterium]|nr:DUF4080 domain-containing protein [Bacteroidales bacterium]